jgi:hypothetical protein
MGHAMRITGSTSKSLEAASFSLSGILLMTRRGSRARRKSNLLLPLLRSYRVHSLKLPGEAFQILSSFLTRQLRLILSLINTLHIYFQIAPITLLPRLTSPKKVTTRRTSTTCRQSSKTKTPSPSCTSRSALLTTHPPPSAPTARSAPPKSSSSTSPPLSPAATETLSCPLSTRCGPWLNALRRLPSTAGGR